MQNRLTGNRCSPQARLATAAICSRKTCIVTRRGIHDHPELPASHGPGQVVLRLKLGLRPSVPPPAALKLATGQSCGIDQPCPGGRARVLGSIPSVRSVGWARNLNGPRTRSHWPSRGRCEATPGGSGCLAEQPQQTRCPRGRRDRAPLTIRIAGSCPADCAQPGPVAPASCPRGNGADGDPLAAEPAPSPTPAARL